jgi:hypothetical protein
MSFDAKGRRIVSEGELLRCWVERMDADPAHQYRLRKDRTEKGETR